MSGNDAGALPANTDSHSKSRLPVLVLGALGIVYGDIGTSPLYAVKESFGSHAGLIVNEPNVLGIISLIFWTITLVVSLKYVMFIMQVDNRGEGGSMALLSLVAEQLVQSRWLDYVVMIGLFASALFFSDSIITPAVSVLSAVEGLNVAAPAAERFIIPIATGVLIGLFAIQKNGTTKVGKLFGPVMCIWFLVLALMGIHGIMLNPSIIKAVNPYHAYAYMTADPWRAFLSLGSVVLAVTGGEALYADMGHFGKQAIRIPWFGLIMPALVLNYMGQGALLLSNPETAANPFYMLAPAALVMPLIVLATMATIIASQAVISGAFSMAAQAVHLGFFPRLEIVHTSEHERGQVYMPFVNWALFIMVMVLVASFHSSSNLAAAYGIAVTGTMSITTVFAGIVAYKAWRWPLYVVLPLVFVLFVVDATYFAANAMKIMSGGWVPIAVGAVLFTLFVTWRTGRSLTLWHTSHHEMSLRLFLESMGDSIHRVKGTGIFLTGGRESVPHSLLHNLKHNKVLHERVILLTVAAEEVPRVEESARYEITPMPKNFYRVVVRHGFVENVNMSSMLKGLSNRGLDIDLMQASFFLSREKILPALSPGMAMWRERLFSWMAHNATSPTDFFGIPTNRVVEIGTQIEI